MADESSPSNSGRFSLRDLSVAAICISVLLALVVPLIQVGHESSRQTTCANHLRLFGVAILNFQDTRRGLPPLTIGEGRASIFVLLLPYLDAGPNPFCGEDGSVLAQDRRIDGPNGFWSRMSAQEKESLELHFTRCPARFRNSRSFVTKPDDDYFGPTGDYAVVFFNGRIDPNTSTFRAGKDWDEHYDPCDEVHVERQFGAIRLAMVDCGARGPDYRRWQPRDTFARITDGTSHTLILGEKYVRRGELNRYADDPEQQDGTFLFEARGMRSASVARNLWFPLARADDPRFRLGKKAGPQRDFGFGGPHRDGVLFGVADGSVRTVAHQTNRTVVYRLGHCQDALGLAGVGPLLSPADTVDLDDPSEPAVPAE